MRQSTQKIILIMSVTVLPTYRKNNYLFFIKIAAPAQQGDQ